MPLALCRPVHAAIARALLSTCAVAAIAPAAALAQSAETDTTLDTISVVGTAAATGPVTDFVPQATATATKTDTPILETPQSVVVVGQEQMQVTGATSLASAFNYGTGVTTFGGEDGTGDSLLTRGFRLDPYTGTIFRDGMRWAINVFDGGQELYGLERAEVLKGPASMIYGQSGPAGILNTISKRPTPDRLREIGVEYGTNDWKVLKGDFGGPIDAAGAWSWRLTGLVRDAEFERRPRPPRPQVSRPRAHLAAGRQHVADAPRELPARPHRLCLRPAVLGDALRQPERLDPPRPLRR